MRGFLAIGVFIHHSTIWYQYIQIGKWDGPKSNLYSQLGSTSVAFFFMITSFLFISKLLNHKEGKFDWKNFFISRIFRLAPMYYFSFFIILLFVLIITHFSLQVDFTTFSGTLLDWCLFTIRDNPKINNLQLTNIINSGVTWSLPFEWFFYFSLPLISLFILKAKPSKLVIILSSLFVIYFLILNRNNIIRPYMASFIGGAIAPFVLKYSNKKIKYDSFFISCVVVVCLLMILQFANSDGMKCKIFVIISFTLIALGNTVFGLLKSSTLKLLGEVCYSTYLLHGIILFATIYFGYGLENAKKITDINYCLIIASITPLLVIVSFLCWRFIEKPFMDKAKTIKLKEVNFNKTIA